MKAFATSTIAFGLVTVPIKIYASTSPNSVEFHWMSKKGNRVQQKLVDAVTKEEVERSECSKGVEYAKNQYVVFTNEELEAFQSKTDKLVSITEFVDRDSVDSRYIEKTYFLGPGNGGDRGYALLAKTMNQLKKVAVAQWTNRGRDYLVTIAPYEGGLVMHQCFYLDEIRNFDVELPKVEMTKPEELVAQQLIKALDTRKFDPSKYQDRYAHKVRNAVAMKAAGSEIAVTPEAPKTGIIDLYEALKASLLQTPPKTV